AGRPGCESARRMMRVVWALLLVAHLGAQIPGRRYWLVSIDSLATGRDPHTHVQTVGRVRLIRFEADSDIHIKLTGVRSFVVLELIPGLRVPMPALGQRIRAFGISRWDKEHGWQEIHPCERWEPVP